MATDSPASDRPNASLTMSAEARARMRGTERIMLKYYNDMGKNKGNCTWGIGFYAHKGVCSPEELQRKVDAPSIEIEFARRIAEAERRVKAKVKVPLTQDQFDAIVSFTYNTTHFANAAVYDALNENNLARAATIISDSVYVKVAGKKRLAPGLITRRAEESAPFKKSQSAATDHPR